MKRINKWQDAKTTGEVELDFGDGLTSRIPTGNSSARLKDLESKNTPQPTKSVRLDAGQWVWDTTGGTHYVIPDHTGELIIREKPWPTPNTTPSLNW